MGGVDVGGGRGRLDALPETEVVLDRTSAVQRWATVGAFVASLGVVWAVGWALHVQQ